MSRILQYPELKSLGIPHTYGHLLRLMARGTFPQAIQISANRVGWDSDLIDEYRATRPPAGSEIPVLWPPVPRTAAPRRYASGVGRPRGSRVLVCADGRRHLVIPAGCRIAVDADGRRRVVLPVQTTTGDAAD